MPETQPILRSRYDTLVQNEPLQPGAERGFWGDLADTYAIGVYGQIKDQLERREADQFSDPNFDPLDHIPERYQQYAMDLRYARSQQDLDIMLRNIDENNDIRARQNEYSFGYNFLLGAITGIVDPINVLGPTVKGASFLTGAAKGALVYGSLNAGQEVLRDSLDPTSTNLETGINITAGYLLSGLFAGASAHFSRTDISNASIGNDAANAARRVGDSYDEAFSSLDGYSAPDRMSFMPSVGEELDVKIVYGNTGKYDTNGNYVAATYRSAEAASEMARRARVQRAADDALGDVVPDEAVSSTKFGEEVLQEQDLPLGKTAVAEDAAENVEDTIYIDDAAILAKFDEKPWTVARTPGVDPLPDNAFETDVEWLNFVVRHEMHHATTKRLPNESKAAYENRINTLAYQDIKAGRMPLSPTDSFLEKVMLAPTPQGEAMRLAPRETAVHELLQNTAGDMATTMVGNRVGLATTPGGSVFQKAQRWLQANYVLRVNTDAAYVKYVTGQKGGSIARTAFKAYTAGLPIVGQARKMGKLSPKEFREYIGRASQTDRRFNMHGKPITEAEHAIIMEASHTLRKLFRDFGDEAEKLEMFEVQKRISRNIERLQKSIARRTEKLNVYTGKLRTKIQSEIDDFEAELADVLRQQEDLQANPIKPFREKYYFPRIYDLGKIRSDLEGFTKIISNHFGGDAAAETRARDWVEKLLNGGGEDDFALAAGGPVNILSRRITLTNEELADYIVWDSEIVMGVYSRRMGANIEMVRAFGSRMQEEQIDNMVMSLRDKGFAEDKITEIVRLQEDMRDRVLGRFHAKDPMSWDNRAARAIKNFTNITVMGRGIYAQVNDLARAVALNGFGPLFKAFKTAMDGEFKQLGTGKYAKQAGEALELVNARWAASLVENDSALTVTGVTGVERALAAAQSPFFRFNLMNPFTTIWKDFTGIMSGHTLIDESIVVANAIRSGKTLETLSKSEKRIADRLASFGIDLRSAQLIADMPFEKTEGGLYLANIENWSGRTGSRAKEVFLGALSGQIRTGVVTPGPLQRANIMDGVYYVKGKRKEQPLLSLPFQLLSFSLSSSAKVTHAMLSGRDRNRAVTLASLYLSGMLATYLRAGDNWEYKDWDEIALESLESSAITGYLTDIYKRVEDLTGYGPRAAIGAFDLGAESVSDELGAVGGPGVSVIAGAIEAFVNPDMPDRTKASLLRRSVPFTGMWFWSDTLKEWSNWAADAGWLEDTTVELPDLMDSFAEEAVSASDFSPLSPQE